MIIQKFYRKPWTKERVEFIAEWWPHFGTRYVAEKLGLTRRQVKAKADGLGLAKLPKSERKCKGCSDGRQYIRRAGHYCPDCFSEIRASRRRTAIYADPLNERFKEFVRTAKYRNTKKSSVCDIDIDFLLSQWERQNGKCYYSNVRMTSKMRVGERTREASAVSMDRLDSKLPYLRENVVLCSWWANMAKSNLSAGEFIAWCKLVCDAQQAKAQ